MGRGSGAQSNSPLSLRCRSSSGSAISSLSGIFKRPICFVGALGRTLNVQGVRLACGPRAPPRSWTLLTALDRRHRREQAVIHRECGVLKTSYEADMALYPLPIARWTVAAVAVLFFAVVPLTLHEYYLSVANLVWVAIIGALGLNILVGYTGQVSIGHGAFMSVGAYTAANLANRLGSPWPVNLLAGGLMAALIGAIVGIPSLRIKGLYLAISSPARQLSLEWTINHVTFISGGVQASIEVARPRLGTMVLETQRDMYYFLLVFVALAIVGTMNLMRTRVGRAFIAIRDHDIAAEIIGISIFP